LFNVRAYEERQHL